MIKIGPLLQEITKYAISGSLYGHKFSEKEVPYFEFVEYIPDTKIQ